MSNSGSEDHQSLLDQKMGVGTWAWGERLMWGFGGDYDESDLRGAFFECLEKGIKFFDTAEVYAQGRAEGFLGRFREESNDEDILIASKFMPHPWRLSKRSLVNALRRSLKRLGVKKLDLYQIHRPLQPLSIETWLEAMVNAKEAGLIEEIGVSNFNTQQLQRAYEFLSRHGVKLFSNQIEFNILKNDEETQNLINLSQELSVQIIAYSPLAQGLLTGKYSEEHRPSGVRGRQFTPEMLSEVQPLLSILRRIGANHSGRNAAQVALNWVIHKGAIPIPGVKNVEQAAQAAEILTWELTEEEIGFIDRESKKFQEESK